MIPSLKKQNDKPMDINDLIALNDQIESKVINQSINIIVIH